MSGHGREWDNSSSCIPTNLQPLELGPNPSAPVPWLPSSLPRASLCGFGVAAGFSISFSLQEVQKDFGMSQLGTGPVPGLDSLPPPPTCAGETLPDFGPGPPETLEWQNSGKLPRGIPWERKGAPSVGSRAVQGKARRSGTRIWGVGFGISSWNSAGCWILGKTGEAPEPQSCSLWSHLSVRVWGLLRSSCWAESHSQVNSPSPGEFPEPGGNLPFPRLRLDRECVTAELPCR